MPSTTLNRSMSSIDYCFLLKCLAGVALAGFIIAMLMKPTYIVVAAATAMAPALGTAIFLPLVALLALTLIVGLAASLSSVTYVPGPRSAVVYPWYQPAGWFGPTYANYGWFDFMFGSPRNYHSRNWGGTVHPRLFNHGPNSTGGGNLHGHTSPPFYDNRTTHRHNPVTSASSQAYQNHSILRTNQGTGVPPTHNYEYHTSSHGSSHHGHR